MRTAHSVLLMMALATTACGGATIGQYASFAGSPDDDKTWDTLKPGQRIALFHAGKKCDATIADDFGSLAKNGTKLGESDWGGKLTVWTIKSANIQSNDGGGDLYLGLQSDSDERKAVRYAMGQKGGCLWRATPAMDEALKMVGQQLVYTPTSPGCVDIEAAGRSPDAAFIDGDQTTGYAVEAVEIGPATADRVMTWSAGVPQAVWLRTSKGALHVRLDTLKGCFAPAAPSGTPDVLALVRTPMERCEVEAHHVACRSSLGVWEGVASNGAVSLQLVRRTLGSLHIVDGSPVRSGRYARSVVAVDMAKARDGREATIYATMQSAVAQVLSGGDGSMRVVPADDPSATLRIGVQLHDLTIGDLQTRSSTEQSSYEDHKETRPNPDLPKAQAAVTNAEQAVTQAINDYNQRKQAEAQAHDACVSACQSSNDANFRNICVSGCNVASTIADIVDNDSGVQQARANLTNAQAQLSSTPPTVEVPIMMQWSYKKTSYSRSVSAGLDVDAKFPSGPRHWSKPLTTAVEDYEVAGDARHNVQGHSANRDIMDRPDTLLPRIGALIADELAKRVRAGINQEREERAVKAFEDAGHEAARIENRGVDAAAFDVAGARVRKPLQHGAADLGADGSFSIPAEVAPPSCLLVVAAASDPEAQLKLSTAGGTHGDLRGGSSAAVEICPGEGTLQRPEVKLTSSKPVQARWGVYATDPGSAAQAKP